MVESFPQGRRTKTLGTRSNSGRRLHRLRWHAATNALIAPLIVVTFACRNVDVVTDSYATLDEARQAGALKPGRMPADLPTGARDLREARDLDTPRRWGLFSFPPEERDRLMAILDAQELPLAGQVCDVPARIEWWPVLLRGPLDPERIRATGLHAYRSRSGDLVFAVNWNQGRAYYWTMAGESAR